MLYTGKELDLIAFTRHFTFRKNNLRFQGNHWGPALSAACENHCEGYFHWVSAPRPVEHLWVGVLSRGGYPMIARTHILSPCWGRCAHPRVGKRLSCLQTYAGNVYVDIPEP